MHESNSDNDHREGIRWDQLSDLEKNLCFIRLKDRIESRAKEATEWRKFIAKVLVASNSTAAAATLAFIAAVSARENNPLKEDLVHFGVAAACFFFGFLSSMIFLLVVYMRSRETLIKESRYLNNVIFKSAVINWHSNPNFREGDYVKLVAAIGSYLIATLFFLFGVARILITLIFT